MQAATGSSEPVTVEHRDRVAVVRLNRPQVRNAMNRAMVDELARVFARLDTDAAVGAVVLCGNGPSFCSGLDLSEARPGDLPGLLLDGLGDREAPYRLRKPLIGAVTGAAYGAGFELALMCDLLLCEPAAKFRLPEITIGGMPGAGGTQRLMGVLGYARALEACLSGRVIAAAEALERGLVLAIHDASALEAAALELAARFAAQSLPSVMLIKQAMRGSRDLALGQSLALERLSSYACMLDRIARAKPAGEH